jgi:YegS/Rv2252/BmrU family lipid kinase
MKPLVILNPNAQGGRTGGCADELERVIGRYLGAIDTAHTTRPRHATEIAESAALEGRATVVAVGGDGTIHEVVCGLMRARDAGARATRLGIVGQGTGGDFRRTLGLEHRLDRYCQVIAEGHVRAVDVGRFDYATRAGEPARGFFVNILSAGMGGLVDEYVARSSRALGGSIAYLGASLRALVESEVGILYCTLRERGERREVELHSRMVAVCNGRFFGGGMQIAPMAAPDDGLLHVVSLGSAPRWRFLLASLSVYSGRHVDHPEVEIHTCDAIDMILRNDSIRDRFLLDVDGEPLGTLPLRIELVPRALEIFAPRAPS